MGVYIPNLEIPTSCFDCPVSHPALGNLGAAILGCPLIGKTLSAPFCEEKRMDNCPLVSVPPHSRLIDADALAEHKFVCIPHVSINGKDAGTAYRLGWNTAIEAVMENAETIIGGE